MLITLKDQHERDGAIFSAVLLSYCWYRAEILPKLKQRVTFSTFQTSLKSVD